MLKISINWPIKYYLVKFHIAIVLLWSKERVKNIIVGMLDKHLYIDSSEKVCPHARTQRLHSFASNER